MQGSIRIDERSDARATVLAVGGELDVAASPGLSHELNEIIRRGEGDLVVDLTRVSFVDSTGLAVLLNALRRLTRARRRMALIIGAGAVARAFEVTRLNWTFDVFDDVESALERSRPTPAG
jgi:anti-sigma B factor antagonist